MSLIFNILFVLQFSLKIVLRFFFTYHIITKIDIQVDMSYIACNQNDLVYVKDIGYGTLINCGKFKTITIKTDLVLQKKQSIYFDPELFNSQSDSNHSKKSQNQSGGDKKQQKPKSKQKQSQSMQKDQPLQSQNKQKTQQQQIVKKQLQRQPNIVTVQIDNTKFLIYTDDANISKKVTLQIKPILQKTRDLVVIDIQINKTIQSLKKIIFDQIGQSPINYYNVRLFTTSPILSQLSLFSKTVGQYRLKDYQKIILQGSFAFNFSPIPALLQDKLSLSNGSLTLSKPGDKKQNITKQSTTITKQQGSSTDPNEKFVQMFTQAQNKLQLAQKIMQLQSQQQQQLKRQQQLALQQALRISAQQAAKSVAIQQQNIAELDKKQSTVSQEKQVKNQIQEEKEMPNSNLIQNLCKCNVQFSSGRHYWEFKIDKTTHKKDNLWVGVTSNQSEGITHAYLPLKGKKYILGVKSQYGLVTKQSDTIGILLKFNKNRKASLICYKNLVNCGVLADDLQGPLIPIVLLEGDVQISLNSRAQFPIQSYRSLK